MGWLEDLYTPEVGSTGWTENLINDTSTYTPFDSTDWGDTGGITGILDSGPDIYDSDFSFSDSFWDDPYAEPTIDWNSVMNSWDTPEVGSDDWYADILGDTSTYTPFDPSANAWEDNLPWNTPEVGSSEWLTDILGDTNDFSVSDILGPGWDDILGTGGADPTIQTDTATQTDTGEKGPLGGNWWPAIRNFLIGSGEGPLGGGVTGGGEGSTGGAFGALLSILGLGGEGGGIFGGEGGGIFGGGADGGGFLSGANPLLQFLAMKSLMKDDQGGGAVPVGGEAYGGPAFNYQDYQPTNLKPALMPGVGYANVGVPQPPGMRAGGRSDGPGDITFAKLEPGEFVIQKPVVDAVGIERLEQLNNMFG